MKTGLLFSIIAACLLAGQSSALVTLGFGLCNSQGAQTSPVGNGAWFNPYTSVALNDWTFGTPLNGTDASPVVMPSVVYLQLQLIDTAPYLFDDNHPLGAWGVQLAWTGAVSVSPDSNTDDGLAFNLTVNNGGGHSNENLPYANGNVVGDSFGISQLLLSGWSNLPDSPATRCYALANVRVDVWGPGMLTMTDINGFQDNWADMNGSGFDAAVFAGVQSLTVVPEPSSMVLLAGLAACGVIRRRVAA